MPALQLDARVVEWLALIGTALAALSMLVALLALSRMRRLRQAWRGLGVDRAGDDLVTAVGRQRAEVGRLRDAVEAARADVDELRDDVAAALRHVAVVRYDAFDDMGGRLSFSTALLDDNGDGVVISSISGRSDTRTYAKGVRRGASEQPFSPEEQQAVEHALKPRPREPRPAAQ